MTGIELVRTVGANVAQRRRELQMSQRDVALKANCSAARISQIEGCADDTDTKINITTDALAALAVALRCQPSQLLVKENFVEMA